MLKYNEDQVALAVLEHLELVRAFRDYLKEHKLLSETGELPEGLDECIDDALKNARERHREYRPKHMPDVEHAVFPTLKPISQRTPIVP